MSFLKQDSCGQIGEMQMYFKMTDISGNPNSYNVSKSGSLGNEIQLIFDVNCIVLTVHLKERAEIIVDSKALTKLWRKRLKEMAGTWLCYTP